MRFTFNDTIVLFFILLSKCYGVSCIHCIAFIFIK